MTATQAPPGSTPPPPSEPTTSGLGSRGSGRHRDWARERSALRIELRMAAATVLTTWLAMWSWRGFTAEPGGFLGPLLLVALTVGLVGALARWRRVPGVLVVVLQALIGGIVVCLQVAGRPYPGPAFWEAFADAVHDANTYAPPVPVTATIDVVPLLLVSGLIALLIVDLCAGTLRRAPLAGLPLLTIYSVPVSLLGGGLSWPLFAGTAAGFLAMLFFQEEEHLTRWGRSLDGAGEPVRRMSDSVRGSAFGIGAAAVAAAVVIPMAIPTFNFSIFDVGPGGDGDGDIQVTNPMADLRRDLQRGEDIPLLTVRTDDPMPNHLRISVLNRFTEREWSAGDRSVPSSQLAQGDLPALAGVEAPVAEESATYDYQVEVSDSFDSRWLPTQAPIDWIRADGDWRFDTSSMDFLAGGEDQTTAGMSYEMNAVRLAYDDARLLDLDTQPAAAPSELTTLPDDVSKLQIEDPSGTASLETLTRRIVGGTTSDFQAAVALQQWFRKDGGFTYDLAKSPPKVGADELQAFLSAGEGGRVGYCEQYAASMAVMARILDIPSRVAVGFLQPDGPDVTGEANTYVYSSHDLHAWVELFFPGAGWVLFDPTPQLRVPQDILPTYTTADIGSEPLPTGTSEPRPTREPSATAPAPTRTSTPATQPQTAEPATESGSRFPWGWLVGVLVVIALVALLVRLPHVIRGRQRARRLSGGPEAAWAELRASALDHGRTWPEGRSPRETAEVVGGWFGRRPGAEDHDDNERPAHGPGVDPDADAALARLVDELERARYSRGHVVEPGTLRPDVLACCAALSAGSTPRARRRATWLPVSVLHRQDPAEHQSPEPPPDSEPVGSNARVDHI